MSNPSDPAQPTGWRSFFTGWHFRTATPEFAPGQQIEAYITGFDEQHQCAVARIGDTILSVPGAGPETVDQLMTLTIKHFDPASNTGQAETATHEPV